MKNKKIIYHGTEKRKFPRASARVIYAVVRNKQYLGTEVYTKDISIGGISFTAKEFIAKDEILHFDIVFPDGKSFAIQGRVLRAEKISVSWAPKEQLHIAAEFINLTDMIQGYIEGHISRFISLKSSD